MKAKKAVEVAVSKQAFDYETAELTLFRALEILRAILSDMPWWKKVLLSAKFLIDGIEGYLTDRGWDV